MRSAGFFVTIITLAFALSLVSGCQQESGDKRVLQMSPNCLIWCWTVAERTSGGGDAGDVTLSSSRGRK